MTQNNKKESKDIEPLYISYSQIKARGWTDSMIKKLLGEHDTEKDNPYYRSGSPMKMYLFDRVFYAEKTEEFAILKEKSKKRVLAGKNAAEKKRQELRDYINNLNISIPVYPYSELISLACDSYNDFNRQKANMKGDFFINYVNENSDESFLARICKNYLRHRCTNYERELDEMFGKIGRQEGHDLIQKKINDLIDKQYPDIAKHNVNLRNNSELINSQVESYSEEKDWFDKKVDEYIKVKGLK